MMRVACTLLFVTLASAACLPFESRPASSVSPMESYTPAAIPIARAAASGSEIQSLAPRSTCVPEPTPEYLAEVPPHAPVNGQPSLGVPIRTGVILVQIQQCRDIETIVRKYGLAGPATRDIPGDSVPEHAKRWFRIAVTPGTEAKTVVELYQHPDDIAYVQLLPEFTGGRLAVSRGARASGARGSERAEP
jgi:hypothetical protein